MGATVAVRRALADEADRLAEIHLASALRAYAAIFPAGAPKPTADALAVNWRTATHDDASEVFAAECDRSIVGGVIATTSTRPGVGNLRHLYVDPPNWGGGAGRLLHDAVVQWCRGRTASPLDLWVLERNDRARAMYERWGWVCDEGPRVTNPGTDVTEVRYVLDRVAHR